ncbi:hypothetical protein V1478_018740 [Vespula squamosa]|uniref:Uncharacterized protein n=1 Tax=Vespula squamosa TaxID=30214 RepID=A0ABD1ZTM3_VESSQ
METDLVPTVLNYDWKFCESVTNSKAQAHTTAYSRCWPTGCSGLCTNRVTKPLIILIIQKRTVERCSTFNLSMRTSLGLLARLFDPWHRGQFLQHCKS